MECLNNLINDYELWHDALAVKIPDAQRAFPYKKLVVGLSERISSQMEHKINYIETRSLMKDINLAQTDPIKLLSTRLRLLGVKRNGGATDEPSVDPPPLGLPL